MQTIILRQQLKPTEEPARRKITLKGCVEKWCQGVLTKRQYVTSWEWEHVGHAEHVLYKY